MAKILCFDWEASGAQKNKAHPYDPENKGILLCAIFRDSVTKEEITKSYWMDNPLDYGDAIRDFSDCDVVVTMNGKYDMAWLKRYGITLPANIKMWDIQVVHFITIGQVERFPSLNSIAEYHELPRKLDIVSTEYWDKGLDTTDVPRDILQEYGEYDVRLTLDIALIQMAHYRTLSPKLQTTIRIALEDCLILFDMEANGFLFDTEASLNKAEELHESARAIRTSLSTLTNTEALEINWGSNDQISAVLYGGTIKRVVRESYVFHYKDPKKLPVEKFRSVEVLHQMPRLVNPLPRTEMAKEGVFATNEGVLRKLKATKKVKQIIDLLLQLAKTEKLESTYFRGIPKIIKEKGWDGDNIIHCGLNQCTVITGRLSCTAPNLQTINSEVEFCFLSRFK